MPSTTDPRRFAIPGQLDFGHVQREAFLTVENYLATLQGGTDSLTSRVAALENVGGTPYRFVLDATARTALAPSSLQEGVLCYQQDNDTIYVWTGSAWKVYTRPAHGGMATYTPSLAGWTLGNGTLFGSYAILPGRVCMFGCGITGGGTTAFTGQPTFGLPPNFAASADGLVGQGQRRTTVVECNDATGSTYSGRGQIGATTVIPLVYTVAGSALADNNISATYPLPWTTSDVCRVSGWYHLAATAD